MSRTYTAVNAPKPRTAKVPADMAKITNETDGWVKMKTRPVFKSAQSAAIVFFSATLERDCCQHCGRSEKAHRIGVVASVRPCPRDQCAGDKRTDDLHHLKDLHEQRRGRPQSFLGDQQ